MKSWVKFFLFKPLMLFRIRIFGLCLLVGGFLLKGFFSISVVAAFSFPQLSSSWFFLWCLLVGGFLVVDSWYISFFPSSVPVFCRKKVKVNFCVLSLSFLWFCLWNVKVTQDFRLKSKSYTFALSLERKREKRKYKKDKVNGGTYANEEKG